MSNIHDGNPMSRLYFDDSARKKVLLATTAYDSPDASYVNSIQSSREALRNAGIDSNYLLLSGNCHVDDARNSVVREFLASDCDELIFIDADVSWDDGSLITLCQFDCDLVGGVYPYRSPDRDGMPVRMLKGCDDIVDGLLEVEGLPTGFMRIKKHVLEKLSKKAKKFMVKGETTPLIFERAFRKEGRFGGDLNFCAKWRDMGGKVYAAADLRLGHTFKSVVKDSLGASLRRINDETFPFIVDRIRKGTENYGDYNEIYDYADNPWVAEPNTLATCVLIARKATGPIIEAGSGLSTILMAAATDQNVYCMEHDQVYAAKLREWANLTQAKNIVMLHAPLKNGWYDTEDFKELPKKFSVGVVDGPPRKFGTRMNFFKHFGRKVNTFILDDMADSNYKKKIQKWATDHGKHFSVIERCGIINGNSN